MKAEELEAKKTAAGEELGSLVGPILDASDGYKPLLTELGCLLTDVRAEADLVSKKIDSHPPIPRAPNIEKRLEQRLATLRQRQAKLAAAQGSLSFAHGQICLLIQEVYLENARLLVAGKAQIDRAFDAYNQALIEYAELAKSPVGDQSSEIVAA